MKITYLVVSITLFYSKTLSSQSNRFEGVWTSDTSLYIKNPEMDSLFLYYSTMVHDHSIQIKSKVSDWFLLTNQFYMGFSNKIIKDTLFLFFKEADVGRGFLSFKESAPTVQSLFAKCFITINGQLSITYLNRKFIKAIKSHLNFSIREEEDLFPKIMYFVRVE